MMMMQLVLLMMIDEVMKSQWQHTVSQQRRCNDVIGSLMFFFAQKKLYLNHSQKKKRYLNQSHLLQ